MSENWGRIDINKWAHKHNTPLIKAQITRDPSLKEGEQYAVLVNEIGIKKIPNLETAKDIGEEIISTQKYLVPQAYLVHSGRAFVDRVEKTLEIAEKTIKDRKDGSKCSPLFLRKNGSDQQHSDDAEIDTFCQKMKEKMARKRAEGFSGWSDKTDYTQDDLSKMLREHIEKSDPIDVAIFCMMLFSRNENIT